MRLLDDKVWNLGYEAYSNCVPRSANPYDEVDDADNYQKWEDGWDAADSDSDDE